MRKDVLTKRHTRLLEKRSKLKAQAQASNDVEEVRRLTAQIEDLNDDIADVEEELRSIEEEERAAQNQQSGEVPPAGAQLVNGQIRAQYRTASTGEGENRDEDPTATMEYRSAFMAYVQKGEKRGDFISTTETGAAIPVTVMREVINTVRKRYGNLYSKVRKTAMQGGVKYAIGALKATFKWINESTVSPRQKLDDLASISFEYHPIEIRIAQSFLASITTLPEFEAKISEVIAVAYLQAMDIGIVRGTGEGQMLGIINDPRVTKVVEMTASDLSNWTKWRKNFFTVLPLGYRAGEFIFPLSTVESYLETMADANNNPIFRQATGLEVNDGDARNPNGRFFGREIALVEPDVLPDFDTAEAGAVIGIFWQPEEYAINENFGFTMYRYRDEETNQFVDKALGVVDGKVLNPEGFVLIKKKAG